VLAGSREVLGAMLIAACLPVAASSFAESRKLADEQRYSEALEKLDTYLAENQGDVEARLFRGVILTRQGKIDEAITSFDSLSKTRPELPEPLNNLAVLYAAQGRYEDAREVLLEAIELEPRYDTAHENLGDVYAKLANIAYERAFALNTKNAGAKDKALWMARVLDTRMESPSEVPLAKAEPVANVEPTPEVEGLSVQARQSCYSVNGIEDEKAADSVVTWFDNNGVSAYEQVREEKVSTIYAVYVPPLADREAANDEIRRMQDDGFSDIMRINSGELKNGVSLGAYRHIGNAERRVESLREKGYQAEYHPRQTVRRVHWVQVSSKGATHVAEKFRYAFPAYLLDESPCP
jgi:tetratricopeptide (TPR) repeat protein